MGSALGEALVELVEQRRIGRGALGLSLPAGRGETCLHQAGISEIRAGPKAPDGPCPPFRAEPAGEARVRVVPGLTGWGPSRAGSYCGTTRTCCGERELRAAAWAGPPGRPRAGPAGRPPGHSICACGCCGAARRCAGYGHDAFQSAPDTIMVSKRAALARMVLEAALLALEELNIGWAEGGSGGAVV